MKAIKEILNDSYVAFSILPHFKTINDEQLKENETLVNELFEDLGVDYVWVLGVDDSGLVVPYVFADTNEISKFREWHTLLGLLHDLGQRMYIRKFQTMTFVIEGSSQVVARVNEIDWHKQQPDKNYFATEDGLYFTLNFLPPTTVSKK